MGDEPDYLLLDRYFAGECTPAEDALLQRWIAERPDRRARVEDLRTMRSGIHLAPIPTPVIDVDAEWAAFATEAARSGQRDAQDRVGRLTVGRRSLSAVGARAARPQSLIAAMLVIAVGVGLAVGAAHRGTQSAMAGRVYATTAGQRLTVTLVDGTHLTLAPASTVRIAADYGGPTNGREVRLDGEAFFEVRHDAARPFAVVTQLGVVRDLGTRFDVQAYAADRQARVVVSDGMVDVRVVRAADPKAADPKAADRTTVLTGGMAATLDSAGQVAVVAGIDPHTYTDWTAGRLVFTNAPLGDVVPVLARWYGLTVRVGNGLRARRLSTTLTTESPGDAIALIAAVLNVRAEWQGATTVTLIPIHPAVLLPSIPEAGARP